MNKLVSSTLMGLLVFSVSHGAFALIALDPDKDLEIVKKEVVNEDGTTSIVEEVVITKPLTLPEPSDTDAKAAGSSSKTREKVTHARGWDRALGKYKAREPMFYVSKTKPKDWPIPETTGRTKAVPTASVKEEEGGGLNWLVWTISLGIIAFAAVKAVLHFREAPDPNQA